MTARALSRATAQALATRWEDSETSWTRDDLAAAFAQLVDDGRADELAVRVVGLVPREPVDAPAALFWILAELPFLQPPAAPLAPRHRRFGVPELPDRAAVARLLDLTLPELDWFCDRRRWLRHAPEPLSHYRYRHLPKARGVRVVEAPKPRLRELQRRIAHRILSGVPAHPACHGFEKGCSAASFAAPHAGAAVTIRIDLRHFFPTITRPRVRAVFAACGYEPTVADTLADLCTTATAVAALRGVDHEQAMLLRAPHLAQGAPTSPRLANLVARNLDRRLTGFARRSGLQYTRYADDLAFSGPAGVEVDRIVWTVTKIAAAEGFAVNARKTTVRRAHQRQVLAGLVVNDRPRVARADYDALRALLHNCRRSGAAAQNHDGHTDFRAHVYGLIAWMGASDDARRQRLLRIADEVDWDS